MHLPYAVLRKPFSNIYNLNSSQHCLLTLFQHCACCSGQYYNPNRVLKGVSSKLSSAGTCPCQDPEGRGIGRIMAANFRLERHFQSLEESTSQSTTCHLLCVCPRRNSRIIFGSSSADRDHFQTHALPNKSASKSFGAHANSRRKDFVTRSASSNIRLSQGVRHAWIESRFQISTLCKAYVPKTSSYW